MSHCEVDATELSVLATVYVSDKDFSGSPRGRYRSTECRSRCKFLLDKLAICSKASEIYRAKHLNHEYWGSQLVGYMLCF